MVANSLYGASVGWHYVIEDNESKAVFIDTICAQTITYVVAALILSAVATHYSKHEYSD